MRTAAAGRNDRRADPRWLVAASEAQEAPGALVPSPGSELDRKAPPRVALLLRHMHTYGERKTDLTSPQGKSGRGLFRTSRSPDRRLAPVPCRRIDCGTVNAIESTCCRFPPLNTA